MGIDELKINNKQEFDGRKCFESFDYFDFDIDSVINIFEDKSDDEIKCLYEKLSLLYGNQLSFDDADEVIKECDNLRNNKLAMREAYSKNRFYYIALKVLEKLAGEMGKEK